MIRNVAQIMLTTLALVAISPVTASTDSINNLQPVKIITGITPYDNGDEIVDIYTYKVDYIGKARISLGSGQCEYINNRIDGYQVLEFTGSNDEQVLVQIPVIYKESATGSCSTSF